MDFFKQYIKIMNYALMGLVFGFAFFYLLSNAYHYLEIRKDFYADDNTQLLFNKINEKMDHITQNISKFNSTTYSGNLSSNRMLAIQSNLQTCVQKFNNETIQSIQDMKKISIIDVYRLRESYENDIFNDCIVYNLHWTTTVTKENFNSSYLIQNQPLIQLYIESLRTETSYLKKDLINNSSYFYNTSAASFIKHNTKDGFYEVMSSYNKAASFVEYISDWFAGEVEGIYD